MSKMGLHDPFGHLKHKLCPKERSGVKLTIWPLTTKSRELTQFPCVKVPCNIPWKSLDKWYNFALNLISSRGLHTKLWGPKVARAPTLEISRLPFGSLGTKCHLDVGLMERHKVSQKVYGLNIPWWLDSRANVKKQKFFTIQGVKVCEKVWYKVVGLAWSTYTLYNKKIDMFAYSYCMETKGQKNNVVLSGKQCRMSRLS
jgi:hypothetical protein